MHAARTAEDYLQVAIDAVASVNGRDAALDRIPVPVYITDANGFVTYWNRASAELAGRERRLGEDRWCVTWRLYSASGDPMPHDQCPMAEAIHKKSPVHGKIAIAMRPDGSRAAFRAYPTPLLDIAGDLTGAVNLLVDVSEEQADALTDQAARCHRLAQATHDRGASRMLEQMACDCSLTAASLGRQN